MALRRAKHTSDQARRDQAPRRGLPAFPNKATPESGRVRGSIILRRWIHVYCVVGNETNHGVCASTLSHMLTAVMLHIGAQSCSNASVQQLPLPASLYGRNSRHATRPAPPDCGDTTAGAVDIFGHMAEAYCGRRKAGNCTE